jgi:anti-sigma factor RsiW
MSCARAEIVAGAIALGEAREDERHAYRAHLAHCSRCVNALGGEREIERTVSLVANARESERWKPDVRRRLGRAIDAPMRLRWLSAAATAIVAVLAIVMLQRAPGIPHKSALPAPVADSQRAAAIAALGTQNVPAFQHQAESLQFRNGATLTLRVVLDGHGKPVRCSVLHGAQRAIDHAFCAAVMRSRL